MSTNATPTALQATPALRLTEALQLLRQSGLTFSDGVDTTSPAGLQSLIDALCEISSRDALTGLANRRQFQLVLASEIDRVARTGEQALMLLIDIDHFKRVNDAHGHAAGDLVLKSVAQTLRDSVRPMDTIARVGGEEFAIILANCPASFGAAAADRIRRAVARRPVQVAPGCTLRVTISLGGAFAPQWVRSSSELWLERADRQLYRAKAEGRNRTCLEQPAIAMVSAEEKSLLFGTSQFQEQFE